MRPEDLLERMAPEQRLLLRSVLCEEDAARRAFNDWRGRVDIDDLDHHSNRLLPLLARRLGEIAPDDPLRARIRGIYRHAWVKNQLLTRDAAASATALHARGVDVIILKGGALLPYYGNDWGARPMYDVDLLVPVDHLENALDVLRDQGWMPRGGATSHWIKSRVVPRRHSFPLSRDEDQELDLHWNVLGDSLGPNADVDFWEHAVPLEMAGVEVRALSPPDLLLHVIAHGAASSQAAMQWIADAVHVLRDSNGEMADRLAEQARRHSVVDTMRAALEAIELAVDEPRAAPILRRLSRTRASALDRVATRGELWETLRRHGDGGEHVGRRLRSALHANFDLDVVNRPGLYLAYAATGRRAAVARLVHRLASGSIAQPPISDHTVALGETLDFRAASTSDLHAGPGWWSVDDNGLTSHGREARVVIDVPTPHGAVELTFHLRTHDDDAREVEVRVNEEVVARHTVRPNETNRLAVHVPHSIAARYSPIEVALLAPRGGRIRRPKVGVRLLELTVTSTAG